MFKKRELFVKVLISLLMLAILNALSFIPIFPLNNSILNNLVDNNGFLNIVNLFTGNGLKALSIMSLSITPYITASIVISLAKNLFSSLNRLEQNGEYGIRKIEKITYILSFILSIFNAWTIIKYFSNNNIIRQAFFNKLMGLILLVIGFILIMIMAKIIDKKGFGDGISIILFFNISMALISNLHSFFNEFKFEKIYVFVLITIITLFIISFIINSKYTKVNVNFSRAFYGSESYIPINFNVCGVMPVIFTTTFTSIPGLIFGLMNKKECFFIKCLNMNNWFDIDNIKYSLGFIIFALLMFLFTLYYSNMAYDPYEIITRLRESGTNIEGINNSNEAIKYLNKCVKKNAVISYFIVLLIVNLPIVINNYLNIKIALTGTSFVIITSIISNFIDEYRYIKVKNIKFARS